MGFKLSAGFEVQSLSARLLWSAVVSKMPSPQRSPPKLYTTASRVPAVESVSCGSTPVQQQRLMGFLRHYRAATDWLRCLVNWSTLVHSHYPRREMCIIIVLWTHILNRLGTPNGRDGRSWAYDGRLWLFMWAPFDGDAADPCHRQLSESRAKWRTAAVWNK